MQPIDRLSLMQRARAGLLPLTLAAFSVFFAVIATPVHAADGDVIARPAAARDAARNEVERKSFDWKDLEDDVLGPVPSKLEPLRDLVDKYAPSAIEWSLLPSFAEASAPARSKRRNQAA